MFRSVHVLADGSKILADEDDPRDSIKPSQHRICSGYAAAAPPYTHLSESQIDPRVTYLKWL